MLAGKLRMAVCALLAVCLVGLAGMCLWTRVFGSADCTREVMLAAAALALPDGSYSRTTVTNTTGAEQEDTAPEDVSSTKHVSTSTLDEYVYSENPNLYAHEAHFPVVETQYSTGEVGYNDFYVKNSTEYELDIGSYLARSLGFEFEDSDDVQVLIVHTHTSESYLTYDAGYYHEGFYPRSNDPERNMLRVGKAVAEGLERQGIGVVQAREVHDDPKYDGAYYRSWDTIEKYIEKYPKIKVVLDLHRDSISYGTNGGKVKPTFTVSGRKAAQIMIMAGYDPDGYFEFPFWEDNLALALKLQDTAEQMYPGMTRPLYFGNFAYNMNINNGSLLIEVGTDANTLEEAVYTGELLSNVLARVLQSG
ncbi:MAG: stage II sporulation protein P [Ruminococcus sp.]|nr:stage II sporulation protein P [Ruminococcus sp.]